MNGKIFAVFFALFSFSANAEGLVEEGDRITVRIKHQISIPHSKRRLMLNCNTSKDDYIQIRDYQSYERHIPVNATYVFKVSEAVTWFRTLYVGYGRSIPHGKPIAGFTLTNTDDSSQLVGFSLSYEHDRNFTHKDFDDRKQIQTIESLTSILNSCENFEVISYTPANKLRSNEIH